jgi:hypothetical protein
MSGLYVECVWLIECSRCSNDQYFDGCGSSDAEAQAERMGWTAEGGGQFCPGCSGGGR